MQRLIDFFYERVGNVDQQEQGHAAQAKRFRLGTISMKGLSMSFIAFMMGRITLAGGLVPFGPAFFAATYRKNLSPYTMLLAIVLGILSCSWNPFVVVKFIAFAGVYAALDIISKRLKVYGEMTNIVKVFAAVFVANVIPVFFDFILYDFILSIFESLVSLLLYFIIRRGTDILLADEVKKTFTFEEVISLGFIGALTIAGIRDVVVFGAQIRTIVCIFIVLVFARAKGAGAGAATGVTMGLVSSLTGLASFNVIGAYAFSGFLAGMFRKLNNVGVVLGFATGNALLTFFLNGSTEVLIRLWDIVLASVLFFAVPLKYTDKATRIFEDRTISIETPSGKESKEATLSTVKKLNDFSKAVEELATTFNNIPAPQQTPGEVEVSNFFDTVADRVCKECSLCKYCWDRKFNSTYQAMFSLLEVLEEKGKIEEIDIPVCFSEDSCAKPEELISTLNSLYEVYRVNLLWKKKVQESRNLMSQQLEGVSQIISNLAKEVESENTNKKLLEIELVNRLRNTGFVVDEVSVQENKETKSTNICVLLDGCKGIDKCKKDIPALVSAVIGKRTVPKGYLCSPDSVNSKCKLCFTTGELYGVSVGVSRRKKIESPISGDSYTFMELKDKKYVLGLSDGMGTGKSAAKSSQVAVDLLEKFLESGFDKHIAIKLINSVLLLKSAEESYATMDISAIDLYSGKVEFVKIGSPPSYIKKGDRVEIIKGASLPAGVMENIDLDLYHGKVSAGDFVIMVTDGVGDSLIASDETADWLADFIEKTEISNPQEFAELITQKAEENYGRIAGDDITVLVAKVWERVS